MFMTLVCVAPFIPTAHTLDKGLVIHPEYLLGMLSGARSLVPSFSELALAKFNLIGTIAYGNFGPSDWELVRKWILIAHLAGFRVFINLWGDEHDPSSVTRDVQQAVNMGADVLFLDEILSIYEMDQTTLQTIINAGRSLNPNLQYYINEWDATHIRRAYEWTTSYAYVRVAEDNYNDKSLIDLNIQLGAQYGKAPAAWLIFAKGSQDFDCYRNLDNWIAYGQLRQISAFFWLIDPAGTWTAKWSSVVAFDPGAYV
jgi:hypothetical protein